jgi:histone H3/H4
MLIVKSNIRKHVELNVGEDLADGLDKKTEEILKKAEERAKANGRRTVYARDL